MRRIANSANATTTPDFCTAEFISSVQRHTIHCAATEGPQIETEVVNRSIRRLGICFGTEGTGAHLPARVVRSKFLVYSRFGLCRLISILWEDFCPATQLITIQWKSFSAPFMGRRHECGGGILKQNGIQTRQVDG